MDRETLLSAIDEGPVRIFMNDGRKFDINSHRDVAIDQSIAYLMYRDEKENRFKAHWLSLVCMTGIERIPAESHHDAS